MRRSGARRGQQFVRAGGIQRHRLFDQHMLAGAQRGGRDRHVLVRGQADIDSLDLLVGQCFFRSVVFADAREIHLLARSANIALNIAQVAREPFLDSVGDGEQSCVRDIFPGFQMGAAHEAESKNGDSHQRQFYQPARPYGLRGAAVRWYRIARQEKHMNRRMTIIPLAAVALAYTAQAQNPLSTEAKTAYTNIKNNLTRMAEKMPDDAYSYKPSPDIRTFGELIAHVASSQMGTCSAVNGAMRKSDAASKTTKADLVAALKESFAECDKAFDSLTDAGAAQMIKGPRGERTKLGMLNGVITHGNEEYGYMAVYLRMKGVVPPSSDRK